MVRGSYQAAKLEEKRACVVSDWSGIAATAQRIWRRRKADQLDIGLKEGRGAPLIERQRMGHV